MASRRGADRRGSFVGVAAMQGRRMSLIESTAQFVQQLSTGNHSLAVPFNYGYAAMTAAGFAFLLYFIPFLLLVGVGFLLTLLYFAVDFLRKWDPNWKLKVALKQYAMTKLFYIVGCYYSWYYHKKSFDVRKWQEETLQNFLKINADTDYSKDHKLASVNNSSDFTRMHPLTKFSHYAPYIERMKNGEKNVLTASEPVFFGTTSGTTGVPAVLPFTKWMMKQHLGLYGLFSFNAERYLPWEKSHRLRPLFKLNYTHPGVLKPTKVPGVDIGPITSNPMWKRMGEIFTSPSTAFQIADLTVGTYVQLMFALKYRDLGAMDGTFASNVYFVFKRMEEEWPSLVQDIRMGKFNKNLDIPQDIRQKLEDQMEPDPMRADELEEEFEKGMDDIAHRIWPELKFVLCITTGPFAIYYQYLRKKYIRGPEIIIYSMVFAATEGFFGFNFWPHSSVPRYGLLPHINFYEFVPVELINEAEPQTVLMDQVQLGKEYELVVTTGVNLNRYRMGDVVRVVSFYNQVPIVEFRQRTGGNLSVRGEKVSEILIYEGLVEAVRDFEPKLERVVDYTCCENVMLDVAGYTVNNSGARHILFVEFGTSITDEGELKQIVLEFTEKYDNWMRSKHPSYQKHRTSTNIEMCRIFPLKQGAFNRLREFILKTTPISAVQLKIPRILSKKEMVLFLINESIL
ncbi:hypothetical protein RvY_04403 [Ramazzottius varieornatus]|uniref:Uncharacterized protein n=1 Tax=Ramazzottius varieornatus TaxID=947166 RepID=A0A1D1UYC2_RAMVA|nr:hypothetical protein RvY_04403 [Ramazzottius varieornatus]